MNLFQRIWATGAIPIGAPGWPELALNVASTCHETHVSDCVLLEDSRCAIRRIPSSSDSCEKETACGPTHSECADGVDGELVDLAKVSFAHCGGDQLVSPKRSWVYGVVFRRLKGSWEKI